MEFPLYVFRVPGSHSELGFTYDQLLVEDEASFDLAIREGFSETILDAKAAADGIKDKPAKGKEK
jgi:hypothetical protein